MIKNLNNLEYQKINSYTKSKIKNNKTLDLFSH